MGHSTEEDTQAEREREITFQSNHSEQVVKLGVGRGLQPLQSLHLYLEHPTASEQLYITWDPPECNQLQ